MLQVLRTRYPDSKGKPGPFSPKRGYDWRRASDWPPAFFTKMEKAYHKLAPPLEVARIAFKSGMSANMHYFEDWGLDQKALARMGPKADAILRERLDDLNSGNIAIITGNYMLNQGGKAGARDSLYLGDPEDVVTRIRRLQNTYRDWGDWLYGVKSYHFNEELPEEEQDPDAPDTADPVEFFSENIRIRKEHLRMRKQVQDLNKSVYQSNKRIAELEGELRQAERTRKEIEDDHNYNKKHADFARFPHHQSMIRRGEARVKHIRKTVARLKKRIATTIDTQNNAMRKRTNLIRAMTARRIGG
jgi:hypothetical protein